MTHDYAGKGEAQRIRDRMKPSAGDQPGQTKVGDGPNRTITTVHQSGGVHNHGSDIRRIHRSYNNKEEQR